MPKLTKRFVENISPNKHEFAVWDTLVPGFGVRVHPSGRRTYLLKYRVGGGRGGTIRKPSIGVHGAVTVDQARSIARSWLAIVSDGGDPSGMRSAERAAPTVADLCERYMKEHALPHKKPRSVEEDERNIRNHVLPLLGRKKIAAVTRPDIERVLRTIKVGGTACDVKTIKRGRRIVRGGPISANRVLALLSKMFNLAERWNLRPGHSNPCHMVKKFPERHRERFLTNEELSRLGDALIVAEKNGTVSTNAIAALRLLVFTGCRLSEILTLRWEYVDFDASCLRLPDSKSGSKIVYLAAPAVDVLEALPHGDDESYVLPGAKEGARIVNLQTPWRRIRKVAGLEDVRLHDLRHSFASVGAAAGLSLPIIGKMLGHSQVATTHRYAHLAADPVKQAVETVAGALANALNKQPEPEHQNPDPGNVS